MIIEIESDWRETGIPCPECGEMTYTDGQTRPQCAVCLAPVPDNVIWTWMITAQQDGNELVAQAWADFDEWHGKVCHDMPDHLVAEWEAMSMLMQIYFYSREHPQPTLAGIAAR